MTRSAIGLCIAAAFGLTISVGAQTTTTDQYPSKTMRSDKAGHEITLTGCLARGADGNYVLNNAHVDDSMSDRSRTSSNPSTTTSPTEPNPSEPPVGTTGTTAAEPASPAPPATSTSGNTMSWQLEGGHDLDKHVGHKIQVTGRTEWNGSTMSSSSPSPSTSTTGTTGTTANSMNQPRLDVSAVKMISSSCQ
jgi:hypothetical protein